MSRVILFLVVFVFWPLRSEAAGTSTKLVGYPDLPSPLPNLKTVQAGSIVIAMGNLQNVAGIFDVRAYGTAIYPKQNLLRLLS
jgi:hypothetical protein